MPQSATIPLTLPDMNFPWESLHNLQPSEVFTREQCEDGKLNFKLIALGPVLAGRPQPQAIPMLLNLIACPPVWAQMGINMGLKFRVCDDEGNEVPGASFDHPDPRFDHEFAADLFCAFMSKSLPPAVIAKINQIKSDPVERAKHEELLGMRFERSEQSRKKKIGKSSTSLLEHTFAKASDLVGIVVYPPEALVRSAQGSMIYQSAGTGSPFAAFAMGGMGGPGGAQSGCTPQ